MATRRRTYAQTATRGVIVMLEDFRDGVSHAETQTTHASVRITNALDRLIMVSLESLHDHFTRRSATHQSARLREHKP